MKLILILLLSFNSFSQDSWKFETDKKKHLGFSAAISGSVTLIAASNGYNFVNLKRGLITGAATSLSAGLFKEIVIDYGIRKGKISVADLGYDLIGTITGSGIAYLLIKLGDRHDRKKAML